MKPEARPENGSYYRSDHFEFAKVGVPSYYPKNGRTYIGHLGERGKTPGDSVIGSRTKVKVVKNKVAPPFKQAEFDVMFDEGISHCSLVVDIAAEANIIQKSGAWYSYGDQRIGQGRENAREFLKANKNIADEIDKAIRAKYFPGDGAAAEAKPAVEKEAKETKEKEPARAAKAARA
jgi:hypothetical protein